MKAMPASNLRIQHKECRSSEPFDMGNAHGWRNLFQSGGGTSARQKNCRNCLWFELETVTSQLLKCDVISYAPYEGLNCTISD